MHFTVTLMRTLNISLALFVFLLYSHPVVVNATVGLSALTVESGPRAAALGDAFVAMSADPLALRYNPAGVIGQHDATIFLGHYSYWNNVNLETGFASVRHGGINYNLSFRSAVVSNIEARNDVASVEPLYLFESRDLSVKAGVSFSLSPRVSIGMLGGWVIEKIDYEKGSALSCDLGAIYHHSSNWTFGASVTNWGGDITLVDEPIPAPTSLRGGAVFTRGKMLASSDIEYLDSRALFHLGSEYSLHPSLHLRAGAQSGSDIKSWSAGLGFLQKSLRIDYAFIPYRADFGSSHLFGLTIFVR